MSYVRTRSKRRATLRGLGESIWGGPPRGTDVPVDPALFSAAQFGTLEHQAAVNGYYPTYNPGTQFANQCRTEANPDGWVAGTGGYSSRPRISAAWYALTDDQKRAALDGGQALRDRGTVCPSTDAEAAAAKAASPFFNAPSQLPADSPYYVAPGTRFSTPQTPAQAAAAVAKTPAGNTVINSSGAQNAPGNGGGTTDTVTSFSFGSLPWWAWLAGGGVLLFALRGKH